MQDFMENENPEEKARRHKEQEVSSLWAMFYMSNMIYFHHLCSHFI